MFGISWVAAQLAPTQKGLGSRELGGGIILHSLYACVSSVGDDKSVKDVITPLDGSH
jgi:hypothetical protein